MIIQKDKRIRLRSVPWKCDICGECFDGTDCYSTAELRGGFGSRFDLEHLSLRLCPCCFDRAFAGLFLTAMDREGGNQR